MSNSQGPPRRVHLARSTWEGPPTKVHLGGPTSQGSPRRVHLGACTSQGPPSREGPPPRVRLPGSTSEGPPRTVHILEGVNFGFTFQGPPPPRRVHLEGSSQGPPLRVQGSGSRSLGSEPGVQNPGAHGIITKIFEGCDPAPSVPICICVVAPLFGIGRGPQASPPKLQTTRFRFPAPEVKLQRAGARI